MLRPPIMSAVIRMSIKPAFTDGVFNSVLKVGASPGKIYRMFSEEELRDQGETFGWLKAAANSFDRL